MSMYPQANQGTLLPGSALSVVSAATTNGALIKNSPANLMEVTVSNVTAAAIYVKFYNKASAPTVGTDVPVLTIPAAAGVTVPLAFGELGKRFPLGLGIAITAAAAATDNTIVTVGAQIHGTYL